MRHNILMSIMACALAFTGMGAEVKQTRRAAYR